MLTIIGPQDANRRLIHPIYHYRFAQVLEQAGRKAEAVEQYERFLRLWEKSNQARPEIKDARLRVAAIRGTSAR